jgi:hypothetical protein
MDCEECEERLAHSDGLEKFASVSQRGFYPITHICTGIRQLSKSRQFCMKQPFRNQRLAVGLEMQFDLPEQTLITGSAKSRGTWQLLGLPLRGEQDWFRSL